VALVLLPLVWPVGVILLWLSKAWNRRDKLIGTLLLPGGLIGSLILAALLVSSLSANCSFDVGPNGEPVNSTCPIDQIAPGVGRPVLSGLFWLILVLPVITAIYLGVRLRGKKV